MRLQTLQAINAARRERRAVVLVTELDGRGEERLLAPPFPPDDPAAEAAADALRRGRSGAVEVGSRPLFLGVHAPAVRFVLLGAVHISQALVPMLRLVGQEPVVVDPRTAFASPERFPDSPPIAQWPEEALPALGLDRYTAFAALTHEPRIDDEGLAQALAAGCFYVGALGSRKSHARRLDRLRGRGVADEALARIHAPIGLPIGATTPAEIAVSILAEAVTALRLPVAQPSAATA